MCGVIDQQINTTFSDASGRFRTDVDNHFKQTKLTDKKHNLFWPTNIFNYYFHEPFFS